ncbi:hypothetical protein ACHAW6_002812 [Cyclotella cf. meneghiniana]
MTQPIQFTLVVDDFSIKYVGKEHTKHLLTTLEEHYKVTTDWTGAQYIVIQLHWDYTKCQVHLHMPDYVKKALWQFKHKLRKKQNTFSTYTHPIRIQTAICQKSFQDAQT